MKIIRLTKGYVTTVDDADFERLSQQRWCYSNGRAVGWDKERRCVRLLHRIIMSAPDGTMLDHIDGNPLNNTRANLRFCNQSGNTANSKPQCGRLSRYKGVSRHANVDGWRAYIKVNYHYITGGIWDKERDAALAYDVLALRHFGAFARLNFPKINKRQHARIERQLSNPKRVRHSWSKFLGVSFVKPKKLWQSYVDSGGKRLWQKTNFKTELMAVIARNKFITENGLNVKINAI